MATAAEISAAEEARRKREQEDAQKQMLAQMSQGGFGGIMGWLVVGLVLVAGFMFAKSDTGKEMLGDLTGWLAKKFPDLAKYLAPEDVQQAEEKNPGALSELMEMAEKAGANPAKPFDDPEKAPEVLFRAMQGEKTNGFLRDMALQNKGGQATEQSQKVMAAVKTLLSDQTKIAALLVPGQRERTFAILEAASPIPFPAGRLSAFITKVGLTADGKPTPLLNQLVTGLTGDSAQQTQAMLQLVKQVDQPTMKALLDGVDTAAIADPALRSAIQQAQALSGNAATYGQVQQLAGSVAQDKLTGFLGTFTDGKFGDSLSMLARDAELRTAFAKLDTSKLPGELGKGAAFIKTATPRELELVGRIETRFNDAGHSFIATISTTPQGVTKEAAPMVNMLNQLLNPTTRRLFRDGKTSYDLAALMNERAAHTNDPKARSFLRFMGTMQGSNPENMNLLLSFAEKIAQEPENKANGARTQRVLLGVIGMATGEPSLAEKMKPEELSAFIKNANNRALIGSLFNKLDPAALDKPEREALIALRQHWGGLQHIVGDEASMKKIDELQKNPPAKFTEIPGDWGLARLANKAGEFIFWNISGATHRMAENRSALEGMMQAANTLKQARVDQTQQATQSAPSPTPRANPLKPQPLSHG